MNDELGLYRDFVQKLKCCILVWMLFAGLTFAQEASEKFSAPVKSLAPEVLKGLRNYQMQYCEDQFGEKFRKDCGKKFAANLKWVELSIMPSGKTAILVENRNIGFCGTAGCSLYLLVRDANGSFIQVLGRDGEVGTISRVTLLKDVTDDHYDLRITWSDGKTHSLYRWNGLRYTSCG